MHRHRMTFNEAKRVDRLLFDLASYDEAKGMMPTDLGMDAMIDFQENVFKKFNYFKRLIQTGEATLESLEDDVVARNGPVVQSKEALLDPDALVEEFDKREKEEPLKKADPLTDLLSSIFGKSGEGSQGSQGMPIGFIPFGNVGDLHMPPDELEEDYDDEDDDEQDSAY